MTSLYKRIIADESVNARRTRRLVDREIGLFNEAMELQADAFEKMGESLLPHDVAGGFAIPALLIKSFTHLRAACKLVLCGYFAELAPLERGVMESMGLALYFHRFPDKGEYWAKGREFKAGDVRKALQTPETYREAHNLLSKHVHPNVESVMALIELPLRPEARRLTFYIPAEASKEELRYMIGDLAFLAFSVVSVTATIYKELLEGVEEWWCRYTELKRYMNELQIPLQGEITTQGEDA